MSMYSAMWKQYDPHALPDVQVDYIEAEDAPDGAGWYYAAGFPGCMPDGDWNGPFSTEEEAESDFIANSEDYHDVFGPDVPTIGDFRDWLRKKPAGSQFSYLRPETCAIGRFFNETYADRGGKFTCCPSFLRHCNEAGKPAAVYTLSAIADRASFDAYARADGYFSAVLHRLENGDGSLPLLTFT